MAVIQDELQSNRDIYRSFTDGQLVAAQPRRLSDPGRRGQRLRGSADKSASVAGVAINVQRHPADRANAVRGRDISFRAARPLVFVAARA